MGTHMCPHMCPDSAVGESTASLCPPYVLEPQHRSALSAHGTSAPTVAGSAAQGFLRENHTLTFVFATLPLTAPGRS